MRKMIAAGFTALFLASGAGAAVAGHNEDGSGHATQDKGLCTAFFNGNKNGWEKNGYPPPFQDLVNRAGDQDGNSDDDADEFGYNDTEEDVRAFCGDLVGGNEGPNGKSDGKGQGGN